MLLAQLSTSAQLALTLQLLLEEEFAQTALTLALHAMVQVHAQLVSADSTCSKVHAKPTALLEQLPETESVNVHLESSPKVNA